MLNDLSSVFELTVWEYVHQAGIKVHTSIHRGLLVQCLDSTIFRKKKTHHPLSSDMMLSLYSVLQLLGTIEFSRI